ncbi:MAG: class I SAM-dependent methyltransferase [Candidatus Brocadiaceae bacterium]|nr:class I SAM-dependent methyltransferase [Candidatus Brocadiaceae bacterium]
METHFLKRQTCRVCQKPELEMVIEMKATPVGDHYLAAAQVGDKQEEFPLDVYFCKDCGQLQLIDVVNPETIYRDYLYETSTSMGLVEHFERYANEVITHCSQLAEKALVVDVGCNDGSFLRPFKACGMRVLGIEPAHSIAQKVKDGGLDVLNAFFTKELARDIKKRWGSVSVISANNVMANIDDLGDFVEGVKELMAPEGIFVFESGYLVDLITNNVLDNIYHEHISFLRLNPLVRLFNDHGMEIINIDHVPTKGGSLRGMVQHLGGPRKMTDSVKEMMVWETGLGYDEAEIYKEFSARMEFVKRQLANLVDELKKENKKISGYGASVGVTTLLYYYGLGEVLDCLYDDNPIKHNLLSPGHKIQVRPSAEIYEQKPDYIILFPWRYSEPIIKKHRKFIEQGGHFIIPLPGVKII